MEHAGELEQALRTARVIGAAIGIVMATRRLSQHDAFELLPVQPEHHTKLRVVADDLVRSGDVSRLPA